jgi:putative intracellular protease/amidase
MRSYYTTARIKETLRQAERLGINTFIGRCDRHITRTLLEYRDEGGAIQWIAQTAPELASLNHSIREALFGGARAIYIHGGQMEYLLAHDKADDIKQTIARIHDAGLPAGVAGHTTDIFAWAEANLDVDFYMCAYYNPTSRVAGAEHVAGREEHFLPENRDDMVEMIQRLRKPAIHYKVFAAGRNDPKQAFAYVAQHLRPSDAVCFGVFTKENPNMLAQDIALFEQALKEAGKPT